MPSTAAWSAASLSPLPTSGAAARAANSVTRTSSSARLRSGRVGVLKVGLLGLGMMRRARVPGGGIFLGNVWAFPWREGALRWQRYLGRDGAAALPGGRIVAND